MKNPKRVIVFLTAVLLVLCFSSCSNNANEDKSESTVSLENKYDLELDATYDKKNKKVLTTFTNNTGNLAVYQDTAHYFYKKSGKKWIDVTESYADICISHHFVSPQKGKNVFNFEFAVYDTAFDSQEEADNYKKTGFDAGEYKIAVKVYVCDPTVYKNCYVDDDKIKRIPDFEKNRKEFYLETRFTVK